MAITYTWKLNSVKKTNVGNFSDVIIGTQWSLTGTDEDNYTGIFYGASPLNVSELDPNYFIDFDNLDEEIILNWIKPQVNGAYWDHVVEMINKDIDLKKNPVIVVDNNDFPWNANTAG